MQSGLRFAILLGEMTVYGAVCLSKAQAYAVEFETHGIMPLCDICTTA